MLQELFSRSDLLKLVSWAQLREVRCLGDTIQFYDAGSETKVKLGFGSRSRSIASLLERWSRSHSVAADIPGKYISIYLNMSIYLTYKFIYLFIHLFFYLHGVQFIHVFSYASISMYLDVYIQAFICNVSIYVSVYYLSIYLCILVMY